MVFGVLLVSAAHLVAVIGQDVPEAGPTLLRHGDGGAEVTLHLAYFHVYTAVVLSDVEVEILVVDTQMSTFGELSFEAAIIGTEVIQEIGQCVPKLDHALSRQRDLTAGPPACYGLGDTEEPPAGVLFQIQIVPTVVLKHHFRLEFSVIGNVVRVRWSERRVKITETGQVVTELGSC